MVVSKKKKVPLSKKNVVKEPATLNEEKLRLTTAQADRLELETAIKRGEYVRCDQADKFFGDKVYAFRNKLISLPKSMSKELAEEEDPVVVEKLLEEQINGALQDLSGSCLKWVAQNK